MNRPPNNKTPKNEPQRVLRAIIWTAVSSEAQAADDKVALQEQERRCREWCDANGCEVVKVLKLTHSRFDTNIINLFATMEKSGQTAYQELVQHWQDDSFDILVTLFQSRLGRSGSLQFFVMENMIENGMQVHIVDSGFRISEPAHLFMASVGAIQNRMDVKRLVQAGKATKLKQQSDGIPPNSRVLFPYEKTRDELGKVTGIRLKPKLRQLWADFATLYLEGISYSMLSYELYTRYGHGRNGKAYYETIYHDMLMSPTFWGNMASDFYERKTSRLHAQSTRAQKNALDRISELTVEKFWQGSPATINRDLRDLLGGRRFVVRGGKIVAITGV